MKDYAPDKIRNVALVGHGSSGKTSLTSAVLFDFGATSRLTKVDKGNTVTDYEPEEIERKISINSAVGLAEADDHKINIVDTPGYSNFLSDTPGPPCAPSGNAGNIQIQAGTFSLGASEGAPGLVEATTSGSGHGGNISIVGLTGPGSPANDVTLSGFSGIRSETLNNQGGTAGDITIETMRLALTEGSAITSASLLNSPGNAGNVTLNATESILVSGSYVTSDVLEGSTGNGGQVTIKTPDLTVNQSSEGFGGLISTSTGSSGSAGTVTINANNLTLY